MPPENFEKFDSNGAISDTPDGLFFILESQIIAVHRSELTVDRRVMSMVVLKAISRVIARLSTILEGVRGTYPREIFKN